MVGRFSCSWIRKFSRCPELETAAASARRPALVMLAVMASMLAPTAADSAEFLVKPETKIDADGVCSLLEALDNAEQDAQVHADCPAGSSGGDRLVLESGYDYAFDAPWPGFPNGAPVLTGALAPLDNAAWRWLTAKEIEIAGQPALGLRMSYAGELGWEIHAPRESLPAIHDALHAAGAPHGLADYGSFAMNALRMEKGFKGAGELTNEVTLAEADVMRFVRLDKDFLGREATRASLAAMEAGRAPWVCVQLAIEPDGVADGHGGEAILHEGRAVGMTSSVAYGHMVGTILAFGYVAPEAAAPGTALEVAILGEPRPARVLGAPPYDPESRRPRADAAVEPAE